MERDQRTPDAATADERELDPRSAAALLEQATRRAQREFDRRPPLLMLLGAALFIVGFGAIWWSVRDEHPYTGPAGWAVAVLYSMVAVWVVAVTTAIRRARDGVGRRSRQRQQLEGAAFGAAWVVVYVFQAALHHAGASDGIVYGIYPATAPFIVVGSAAAAYAAARENTRDVGLGIGPAAFAVCAAFAGPASVWLVMGIGLAALLFGYATVKLWQRHGAPVPA
jgi:hypothetical protein